MRNVILLAAAQTIPYAARLQQAGKQFDLMLYPNRNHAIGGPPTRAHLFDMITRFLEERL